MTQEEWTLIYINSYSFHQPFLRWTEGYLPGPLDVSSTFRGYAECDESPAGGGGWVVALDDMSSSEVHTTLIGGDWNMSLFFPYYWKRYEIIIPIDFHIFQRGSNHQPVLL